MKNAINWFEIPVKNFDRAKSFYEAVLQAEMQTMKMPASPADREGMETEMAFFPCDMEDGGVGGAIIKDAHSEPSQSGSLVYLNGGDDLSVPLSRVEKAGGKILLPKTSIDPHGFMAHFIDTEGNKVAFHSMK